jgi:hypothetical protein
MLLMTTSLQCGYTGGFGINKWTAEVDALGTSLIVCGMALIFSGLVFLLPKPPRRKSFAPKESFEESQERTAYYLQEMREQRHEI